MTYPTKEEKLHPGACTCPACSPDLWAAGIKGSKTPGECNEGLDQSRECTSNAGLGSSPPAPVTSNLVARLVAHVEKLEVEGHEYGCKAIDYGDDGPQFINEDCVCTCGWAALKKEASSPDETFGKEPWRVALPKITEQHTADFIGYRSLMEFKGSKWEWTQDAVDFACMLQGVRQEAMRPEEPTSLPRNAAGLATVPNEAVNASTSNAGSTLGSEKASEDYPPSQGAVILDNGDYKS